MRTLKNLLNMLKYVKKYTSQVKLVCLAEVMNFEDEIVRATDVNKAKEKVSLSLIEPNLLKN